MRFAQTLAQVTALPVLHYMTCITHEQQDF